MKSELSSFELECITASAYEVNRRYCLMVNPHDHSHVPWEQLDVELKSVAMAATVGISGGQTPQQSHDMWSSMKQAQGWRYGEVKSSETKEHPCLVPFGDLPPDQKAKDLLWYTVVKTMLDTRWRIPQY